MTFAEPYLSGLHHILVNTPNTVTRSNDNTRSGQILVDGYWLLSNYVFGATAKTIYDIEDYQLPDNVPVTFEQQAGALQNSRLSFHLQESGRVVAASSIGDTAYLGDPDGSHSDIYVQGLAFTFKNRNELCFYMGFDTPISCDGKTQALVTPSEEDGGLFAFESGIEQDLRQDYGL